MSQTQLSHDAENIVMDQGRAYDEAVNYVKNENRGITVQTDDYIITVACEPAEGIYVVDPEGGISWQPPSPDDNQHIKIMVQDRLDHRFVPELQVYCKLQDMLDNFVEEKLQRFVWHPIVFHYGENWSIPGEADYILSLTIKHPHFRRHDHDLGKRFDKDITLDLSPIHIIPSKNETSE